MQPIHPPALATALLERFIPPRTSTSLIGDLIEEHGNGRSLAWYWQQTVIALTMSAFRQAREQKFQAATAILLGYLCAIPLCYFASSGVGKILGAYTMVGAYLLFLPVAFLSAALSGWIVSRSHSSAMVLVWATFCIIASAMALAMYLLFATDRMSLPMTVVVLAQDFVVGPLGVLAGGLVGARAESQNTREPKAESRPKSRTAPADTDRRR